ncbi:MAG: hypothetical protein E7076_08160 [Bacteroidales bacterium]|nr:hypothetical protein [Bacteroidales bacterium]
MRKLFLLLLLVSSLAYTSARNSFTADSVTNIISKLEATNNFIEKLDISKKCNLPIGVKKTIANAKFILAISRIEYKKNYAEVDLIANLYAPARDLNLCFGAKNIKMALNGEFIDDVTLALLSDADLKIFGGNGNFIIKGGDEDLSFARVDCNGLKEFGITADITLNKSTFHKVINKKVTQDSVSARIQTTATDLNDIVAKIELPDFAITGLDGFIFTCNDVVFDFSDTKNSPATIFPKGYENYVQPDLKELWNGIYAHKIQVTLPPQFKKKDNDERIAFSANDMIIDENGVSGIFIAETPLLSIDNGSASGWSFSVDKFQFSLLANALSGAGFCGEIGLPMGDSCRLAYDALFDGKDYYMIAKPAETLGFNVFKAKAQILPESYVKLAVIDGSFCPEAMLHGSMGITVTKDDGTGKEKATFKGVQFQSLHLQTHRPYLSVEYFGYKGGGTQFMNLPLAINEISLTTRDRAANLTFDIDLELADAIKADGRFNINSEIETGSIQRFKYKSFEVERLLVEATIAGTVKLEGSLETMEDDAVFGDGVYGGISMTFQKALEGLSIKAQAMFGKKDFNYWFVDASVGLPKPGIQIGYLTLNGFSGGLSQHMKKTGEPTEMSPSGCGYRPDISFGLGLKSAVLFSVISDRVINGETSFEILFNRHGGVNFIGFYGSAKFLGEIPGTENLQQFTAGALQKSLEKESKYTAEQLENLKTNEKDKAAEEVYSSSLKNGQSGLSASLSIEFDFKNHLFHANFETYAYFLKGLISGSGSNHKAGWSTIHIESGNSYMYIGTPNDPIGLKMGIGPFSVKTASYFMAGNNIPAAPAPPQQVADILHVNLESLDYMRDLNALGSGRGIAFGSSLSMDTGDLRFLIFYARLQAGLGFDVMMKDYGAAYCEGESEPLGLDGWYINGQAYAYLQGDFGIKVKLFRKEKKISILKGGAAALMQAKLPNPSWFKGTVGLDYRILGGLIKGHVKFEVKIGHDCKIINDTEDLPIDMELIGGITPETEADVFAEPQAAFNVSIGEVFESVNDDDSKSTLQVVLGEMTIKDDNGNIVDGELKWNKEKDKLNFLSYEIFNPRTKYTVSVSVHLKEYKNNAWNDVYYDGKLYEERREVSFVTGDAPDYIPMENVDYTYPVVEQHYFLPKEYDKGFVQLKKGQTYLFTDSMTYHANYLTEDGNVTEVPLSYDSSRRRLNFTIDPNMQKSTTYNLILTAKLKDTNEKRIEGKTTYTASGDEKNSYEKRHSDADQLVREDLGKELLAFAFGTSRYKTFAEKINGITGQQFYYNTYASDVYLILATLPQDIFDTEEVFGTNYTQNKPLITNMQSTAEDSYFKNDIKPNIYDAYRSLRIEPTNRDVNEYGFLPLKAIVLYDNYRQTSVTYFPYRYELPYYYKKDFVELRNKAANNYIDNESEAGRKVLNYYFSLIEDGTYKVQLTYRLPDGTNTSNAYFTYRKR